MSGDHHAPRIRHAPVPPDALVVVRGDDLIPESSWHQAELFRRRYPNWDRWGLSAFYARDETEIDDLAADQLDRFPVLGIYRTSTLEAAGFEIVPTFRTPHVTIAFTGDLGLGLERLSLAVHEQRLNPYHRDG